MYLTFVYPPTKDDQSGARMLKKERNTIKFSDFVAGLGFLFNPGKSYSREKAVYNFYDYNRQGSLSAEELEKGDASCMNLTHFSL